MTTSANSKARLRKPGWKQLAHPVHFFSLGFGSGLAPKAPGTFGTLVTVPLVMLMQGLDPWLYLAIAVLVSGLGIAMCRITADALGVHDHPAIVLDEIAGYLLAMSFLPATALNLLLAFLLFRFFDIYKPGPIGWCDKKLKGGLGIMADDILAGIVSCVLLHAGYALTNTLL
ncbi:phosphatidylglycerophosphatase A [Pseudidiomarina terrestris]|uniref:Phosphatidylglycerophosphatase A n=1 Tax=Pseudidiomarina terrestris TaxID=2820060 RepID=A0AAW7R3S1_9GAMM|nr:MULTISPECIES: phosphatidylglycerophosphatase A [unclassified Pseudidiomarina]MDN7125149.1 phosphatidylglycerophosphatase A [Pseudidiomarina sp. 1APP75-32.1]MDN7127448.1 phosphatidylglycerophosphatase A [Pseudidiomarina sp. 1APR75-33.1]MDN7129910.1 phosphatidylglycerophosphatase A [Pseudidiomarina sp. 1APR75-15]MDN7136076.1 phosphatidylglycerophosphatase A [Pseudidiomarina sp. 1ASP75-5]MDN7138399.1 phosphatidylglycerophosphatase A [Pseudidiomarina sp. 1ASP75-14]